MLGQLRNFMRLPDRKKDLAFLAALILTIQEQDKLFNCSVEF